MRLVSISIVLAVVSLAAACKQTNALYCCTEASCDEIVTCDDPARPFCDHQGEFPAANGVGHTCIGDPLQTECDGPADCTTAERPFCVDNVCVQCEDAADCTAEAAVCSDAHLCEACTLDTDCEDRAGETRCFTDDGVCVACLEAADCTAATAPVCDDADHACRGCRGNAECASEVCMVDSGECAVADDVIYVDVTGAGSGTCTQAAPCNTIALGLAQVGGSRQTIRLRPGLYTGQVMLDSIDVTIIGEPTAIITPAPGQTAVVITDGANVILEGMTIRDATGTGLGVLCSTTGAVPTVILRGTQIRNNTGGGVSINNCNFDLTNNWIVNNGVSTSTVGGVSINSIGVSGTGVLDFNTIYENAAGTGIVPGVTCGSVVADLTFSSNIVFDNEASTQVHADCDFVFSNIGPTAAPGLNNINTAPTFVDLGAGDYHLQSTSAGIDVGDPGPDVATDIDGDVRPIGAAPDIGADEVTP